MTQTRYLTTQSGRLVPFQTPDGNNGGPDIMLLIVLALSVLFLLLHLYLSHP